MANQMKKISFEKSFAKSKMSKYWNYEKNIKNPDEVSLCSAQKFWFACEKCNHDFLTNPHSISKGSWCPYCSVPTRKLCDDKKCTYCYKKSVASHKKSCYWSKQNIMLPRMILLTSQKKFWFDCEKCMHTFLMSPSSIYFKNTWCPYCANQKLCGDIDCLLCFNKSFASHEKVKYWKLKNDILPHLVFKHSGKKYWFECDECDHSFEMTLCNVSEGQWCGFCLGNNLCNNDECEYCYKKSFASHIKSKYWSDDNTLTPRMIGKNSNNKFWFNCDKCEHIFLLRPAHINQQK